MSLEETFTCRRILSAMVITGFIINAILKTILNITIVGMVRKQNDSNSSELFDWNENQKQNILGIFFWGFSLTKIPSGRLAETFGTRKVTGYSMLFASILTVLTPSISHLSYYLLLTSRVIMGFLVGASWPAIMPLTVRWIPPNEQSVFLSCVAATSVGAAICYHSCGILIASLGWQSVFYVFGAVALIWSLAWFYLVYDSPQQHPRISIKEQQMGTYARREEQKQKFGQIPWLDIVKSGPAWAILAGQVSTFFCYITLGNELPLYTDQVLHLTITQNGIFSGLPYWGGYFAALFSGYLADGLRKSGKMSVTNIRRLAETISLFIPSCCMLVLVFWGNIATVAVLMFTLSFTAYAVSCSGHAANMLDISPNFAGTICGLINTIAAFTPYVSVKLMTLFLQNGHTFEDWKKLFWILFGVGIIGNVVYVVLCSSKLQKWDSKYQNGEIVAHEMEPIAKEKNHFAN